MSLFSFLRKNKQESTSDGGAFYSRAEEAPGATRGRGKRRQGKQTSQADAAADPVLPEKKRARRRLVGAVALVLAAIVGLPMILDSEPKPVADDIAIEIPSKDKAAPPAASGRPANPSAVSGTAVPASLDPKEEIVAAPASAARADDAATTRDQEKTAKESAAQRADEKAKIEAKPTHETTKPASVKPHREVHAASKTETKPAAAPVDRDDDAARARAILAGKADPAKTAEKKPAKFVIQVAALATKEGVNELQARLKDAGIKSYTQKIATISGDRTRIRVGPFGSKDEAEKMRARIVKLGLNGTLVPT